MNFRYDFGNKVDASKFRKQAIHYSSTQNNTWEFYLPANKILLSTSLERDSYILFKFQIFDLKKVEDEIVSASNINFFSDIRYKRVKYIHKYFDSINTNHYKMFILTKNIEQAIDNFINVLKNISKLNNLKAFI